MPKKDIPEAVRRWYKKIGAKGGQAGKGTEKRRELMRQNARKRWAAYKQAKKNEEAQLRKILKAPRTRVPVPSPLPSATLPQVGFK